MKTDELPEPLHEEEFKRWKALRGLPGHTDTTEFPDGERYVERATRTGAGGRTRRIDSYFVDPQGRPRLIDTIVSKQGQGKWTAVDPKARTR